MVNTSKKNVKDFLNNVPEDKVFCINDGSVLRNLRDLSTALADIGDDTFNYHVNKEKNDFRNWILDVIGDKKLARGIAKTKSKEVLLKKLDKRINQLESLNK